MATAEKSSDYSEDCEFFDAKVGAGIVNLTNMLDITGNQYRSNTNVSGGTEILRIPITLQAGDEIQIGLSWYVGTNERYDPEEDGEIEEMYITDYDLRLYQYSSLRMATSNAYDSNTEMIRYTVTESGTYNIVVYQVHTRNIANYSDEIAVAWNIE